jgi:hypothetical protein
VKAKRVLLESVKDHLIPHIVEKTTAKDMYDALVGLIPKQEYWQDATLEASTSDCQDDQ